MTRNGENATIYRYCVKAWKVPRLEVGRNTHYTMETDLFLFLDMDSLTIANVTSPQKRQPQSPQPPKKS